MQEGSSSPEIRVRRYVESARRLADPTDPLGAEARQRLPAATGLSPKGVELALQHYLEVDVSSEELSSLCASVAAAPRAHVLLSANVFVAAHRAIAVALAASDTVFVRPSRREPVMTELLSRAAPEAFRLVADLEPRPGDPVWAYGRDETITALRRQLGPEILLHGHGHGMGVAVVELGAGEDGKVVVSGNGDGDGDSNLDRAVRDLAPDVVVFDQRGCLSPRAVLIVGRAEGAQWFAERLAEELERWEQDVPLGDTTDCRAELGRYVAALTYAGPLFAAGSSWVSLDTEHRPLVVPPPGRNVHVRLSSDIEEVLGRLAPVVTAVGFRGSDALDAALRRVLPHARHSELGRMQKPPLDGTVDRRPASSS